MKNKTLVIAPYPGEFGWELMNWQGRVRKVLRSGMYERAIFCVPPDRRPLYELRGGSTDVRFCDVASLALPGEANEDHRIDPAGNPIDSEQLAALLHEAVQAALRRDGLDSEDATELVSPMNGTLLSTRPRFQDFDTLRTSPDRDLDVLLVPRRRETAGERNQPPEWWASFSKRLRDAGFSVQEYSSDLAEAIRQLSSARLAVGASTGGMHLASLCECPHYVWGSGPEQRWTGLRITNRQRYETLWNPLGAACAYDECGWRPGVDYVFEQTLRALAKIGRPAYRCAAPARRGAAWSLKRRIGSLLEPSVTSRVPWRVREAVRLYVL